MLRVGKGLFRGGFPSATISKQAAEVAAGRKAAAGCRGPPRRWNSGKDAGPPDNKSVTIKTTLTTDEKAAELGGLMGPKMKKYAVIIIPSVIFAIVTIEEARLHFESVPLDDATFPCRLGSTRIALDTAAP